MAITIRNKFMKGRDIRSKASPGKPASSLPSSISPPKWDLEDATPRLIALDDSSFTPNPKTNRRFIVQLLIPLQRLLVQLDRISIPSLPNHEDLQPITDLDVSLRRSRESVGDDLEGFVEGYVTLREGFGGQLFGRQS